MPFRSAQENHQHNSLRSARASLGTYMMIFLISTPRHSGKGVLVFFQKTSFVFGGDSIGDLSKMNACKQTTQRVPMLLKTLLNHCHKFKSFVFQSASFQEVKGMESLVVEIVPRKNNRARCSCCLRVSPLYDKAQESRLFQFVPLWRIAVYFRYRIRRVDCAKHGIRVEALPWAKAKGKSPLTHSLELFLAGWARRLSWLEVARCFEVGWASVYRSDMWKPYLKVIAKKAPQALHVLDRFHIVVNLNKALNQIRASEARELTRRGYQNVLKHTKYCFLKREENLTLNQQIKLKEVLQYDLKSVRAFLLKESFQLFWTYISPYWADWYLKKWCARAMRSRLEPIKKFVKSIRRHQPLILNWFKARGEISSGVVEGLNRKINLTTRKSYGFRSFEILQIALYHTLGELPEPDSPHKFF